MYDIVHVMGFFLLYTAVLWRGALPAVQFFLIDFLDLTQKRLYYRKCMSFYRLLQCMLCMEKNNGKRKKQSNNR